MVCRKYIPQFRIPARTVSLQNTSNHARYVRKRDPAVEERLDRYLVCRAQYCRVCISSVPGLECEGEGRVAGQVNRAERQLSHGCEVQAFQRIRPALGVAQS